MRNECKTGIEKAWLATGLAAFLLHRLLEVETGASGLWLLEGLMIVLTFPFGPIAMLFLVISVSILHDYTDLSWLLDWSTLLLVGYVQWFFVLPEIRRNNRLTTLNLTSPSEIALLADLASPVEIASPVEVASPVEIASTPAPQGDTLRLPEALAPVVFDASAFVPPLAQFDEAGLSALDRVLRAGETPTPAPDMPPSRVETLFLPTHSRA